MKNLNCMAAECISELAGIGISVTPNINFTVNTRAKRRWGQCKKLRGDRYSINISSRLLSDDAPDFPLKNTLIHELLHTLPDCYGHDATWTSYAKKVNEKLGYAIQRCSNYDKYGISPTPPKYVFECADCGQKIARHRRSRFTEHYSNYRCGLCGGKIIKV